MTTKAKRRSALLDAFAAWEQCVEACAACKATIANFPSPATCEAHSREFREILAGEEARRRALLVQEKGEG